MKPEIQLSDWPAGTEVVCYCRATDNRDVIEQLAQRKQWKIVGYVNIEDDMRFTKSYRPGQVLLVKREIVTLTYRPIPICRDVIQHILDGMRVADWINGEI